MKKIFAIILVFQITNVQAQTNKNFEKALNILKQAQVVIGKTPPNLLIAAKGTIHNMGHYAIPESTQDYPISETYAYFKEEQVYHLRSEMTRNGKSYVMSKYAKQDSLYSIGYYDQNFEKTLSNDFNFEISKTLPSEIISFAQNNIQSLRYLGDLKNHSIVSFNYKANNSLSIYINKKTNLLDKIESIGYSNLYGNTTFVIVYKNYEDINGYKIPKNRIDYEHGKIERELVYEKIDTNVEPTSKSLKMSWLPEYFQSKLKEKIVLSENIKVEDIAPNLKLLKIESQNNKVLVAECDDHIKLFESPAGIKLNNQILDNISKNFPNKPLKYLLVTHHHPDHAGGINAFGNLPITIVSTKGNEIYFKKIINSDHSIIDYKDKNTKLSHFEFVELESQKTWNDSLSEVIAYEIGKNTTHTNEHLVYYFPKSKILWTGDLLFFYANEKIYPAGQRGKSVYDLITSKNLVVDKIYTSWPLHGQKDFGTLEDLQKSVAK